jgi:hypothetical protein
MSEKTTVQIKVDKNLNRILNGYAKIRGQTKDKAYEEAIQLYVDNCENGHRNENNES